MARNDIPQRAYAPNRIRELRTARGMTMEQLGVEVGRVMGRNDEIAVATIAKLETGKMGLTLDYMQAIAQAFNISVFELIPSSGAAFKTVPLVGKIAAGKWLEALQDVELYIPVPENVGGTRAFALRPVGDSMDKIVTEEGFIVVDPDDLDLVDRKMYAIVNGGGDTTFKQYRANPPRLEPCSSNPEHQPIMLGREPFIVMGRVVFAGTLL